MNKTSKLLAVALLAGACSTGAATAAPLGSPLPQSQLLAQDEGGSQVQQVQFRRWGGGWRGGGFRGGRGWFGPGLAAGVIGGLALSAAAPWNNYYYGSGYGYGPGYGYDPGYGPGYGYEAGPAAGGNDIAYCQQRFRSYDPASGTYLGYDGARHPCP